MEQKVNIVTLGLKFQVRVSDLGTHDFMVVTCRQCEHTGFISAAKIQASIKQKIRLLDVERKFRCVRCRSLGQVSWQTAEWSL